MPTQSQVQETILTAQLKCADISNTNRVNSMSGVGRVSWALVRFIGLFISAVSNQYEIGDFSSVGFLSCYDSLCKLVGSYGSGIIDPNAHGSGFIIDVTVPPSIIAPVVQISFTNVTGLTINWQTDIPTGYTQTYAQILGNYFPNPVVGFNDGSEYGSAGNAPAVTYSGSIIQTVVFNFGVSQSGFIRF